MNKALWIMFFIAAFFVLTGDSWSQEVIAQGLCPMTKDGRLADNPKKTAYFRSCTVAYDPAEKDMLYFGIYDSTWRLEAVIRLDTKTSKQKSFWKRGEHGT